jgi:hypothetical protein
MQTENPFLEQLAKFMTDAAGAAKSVRDEIGTLIRTQAERLVNDLDLVPREEFEAVKATLRRLRTEVERLEARLAASATNAPPAPIRRAPAIRNRPIRKPSPKVIRRR